jgi:D-alanyl-D-alanine carboxypeptidase (penicillin-binding protein 5/6)
MNGRGFMRKITCLILSLVFMLIPILSLAYFQDEQIPTWSDSIETISQIQNKTTLELDSESAILLDENSGTILYAKNEHARLRPASVTKVMTLLLVMEALDRGEISLDDRVPCSEKARKMGGSQIWLNETEQLTVHEMLKAICVVSANDCSVAIAEFIGGSEEMFVQKMNEKAKELGMNDTTFKNCHGIDEDGHLTSAYDIALMSRELSKNHPKIHEYTKIWMDSLRDGKSQLVNTNKLVRFYAGCTGLKTGSTSLAGFNLSATATRNDLKLIGVVVHGTTSQNRFDDAKKLLDYGFSNFSNKVLATKDQVIETIPIEKARQKEVEVVVENDLTALLSKGEEKNVRTEIIYDEKVSAPIAYKEKVGSINCYLNDELIGSENLLSNQEVKKKSLINYLDELVSFSYKIGR